MLITIEEYAKKHGVNPHTVMYHMRTERIPFIRQYGKRLIDSKVKYPKSKSGRPKENQKH